MLFQSLHYQRIHHRVLRREKGLWAWAVQAGGKCAPVGPAEHYKQHDTRCQTSSQPSVLAYVRCNTTDTSESLGMAGREKGKLAFSRQVMNWGAPLGSPGILPQRHQEA